MKSVDRKTGFEGVYMKGLIAQAIILLVAASAWGHTVTESWEGNHTVLAMYGSGNPPIIAEAIVGGPGGPIDGAQVLQLVDNTQIGANMVYVAWVSRMGTQWMQVSGAMIQAPGLHRPVVCGRTGTTICGISTVTLGPRAGITTTAPVRAGTRSVGPGLSRTTTVGL